MVIPRCRRRAVKQLQGTREPVSHEHAGWSVNGDRHGGTSQASEGEIDTDPQGDRASGTEVFPIRSSSIDGRAAPGGIRNQSEVRSPALSRGRTERDAQAEETTTLRPVGPTAAAPATTTIGLVQSFPGRGRRTKSIGKGRDEDCRHLRGVISSDSHSPRYKNRRRVAGCRLGSSWSVP